MSSSHKGLDLLDAFFATLWKGIKILLPFAITLALLFWSIQTIEYFFGEFFRIFIGEKYYFQGLGTILGLLMAYIIGLSMNAWMGRKFHRYSEGWFKKIPLIRTIYDSVQDIVSFMESSSASNIHPVLVETPIGNLLGFVTVESFEGLPKELGGEKDVLVYLPLSYQIGGYAIVVPRTSVKKVDMPSEEAMRFILMAGIKGKSALKDIKKKQEK